jgi:hypothetical protein
MVVVAAGTMVLERFGYPVQNVRQDGFPVDGEIHLNSKGRSCRRWRSRWDLASWSSRANFSWLEPDVVRPIGDRYEALAAAIAAGVHEPLPVSYPGRGGVGFAIDGRARGMRSASCRSFIFRARAGRPSIWCAWESGRRGSWAWGVRAATWRGRWTVRCAPISSTRRAAAPGLIRRSRFYW